MPAVLRLLALAAAAAVCAPLLTGSASAAPPTATTARPNTHTITVGSNPYDVAVAQNLGKAFVVNDGSVSVISLITRRHLGTFGTGGYHGQNSIALVRSNAQAYITNNLRNDVTVVDTETHRVTRHIPVGYGAVDVVKANTPNGQRAYVLTNQPAAPPQKGHNELVAIDTRTGKVVKRTPLPNFAYTMAVGPASKSIWVGSNYDGSIWQVRTATGKITKTLKPTQSGPVTGIAFTPGQKRAWIAGLGGVTVVDTKTGKTGKFLTAPKIFGGFPALGSIALNSSGRYAFAQNSVSKGPGYTSQIAAINTKTFKISWRVNTGSRSEGFSLDKTRGTAYVADYDDDTVTYFPVPK
ncbi:MAG TPA: YncE family protein [Propionibacteriaceae bacterium]|nr:YncE family protein [Propionibacteriaceae bacterium]